MSSSLTTLATADPARNPFMLARGDAVFRRWRDAKLAGYPASPATIIVEVKDLANISAGEREELLRVCRKTNMAIYRAKQPVDKPALRAFGQHLGLRRLTTNPLADDDGITSLQALASKAGRGYIPYSSKPLSWHTDGYYNAPGEDIRAFALHCVRAAASGGENRLLDPEIVYLYLRERDPAHIAALMAPDAMDIPPNEDPELAPRAKRSGPVFSVDAQGNLHMRYTARTRSIAWKQDAATQAAKAALEALLADTRLPVFTHRLAPGEGIVCNNVLHSRSAFTDAAGAERLLFRARYYDRILDTDANRPHYGP